jgi:hypothetical protein
VVVGAAGASARQQDSTMHSTMHAQRQQTASEGVGKQFVERVIAAINTDTCIKQFSPSLRPGPGRTADAADIGVLFPVWLLAAA